MTHLVSTGSTATFAYPKEVDEGVLCHISVSTPTAFRDETSNVAPSDIGFASLVVEPPGVCGPYPALFLILSKGQDPLWTPDDIIDDLVSGLASGARVIPLSFVPFSFGKSQCKASLTKEFFESANENLHAYDWLVNRLNPRKAPSALTLAKAKDNNILHWHILLDPTFSQKEPQDADV